MENIAKNIDPKKSYALNPIVRRAHKVNPISVKHTEAERGAPIVLIGLIQEAEV